MIRQVLTLLLFSAGSHLIIDGSLTAGSLQSGWSLKAPPKDEAPGDPSFMEFRRALLRALERDDRQAIEGHLALDVELFSSDAPSTPAAVFEYLSAMDLKEAPPSLLDLRWSLKTGVVRKYDGFEALYIANLNEEEPSVESGDMLYLVTAARASLRSRAADNASVVEEVGFEILRGRHLTSAEAILPRTAACSEWLPVLTTTGRDAWICGRDARDIAGPYYFVEKRGGVWKLTAIYGWD